MSAYQENRPKNSSRSVTQKVTHHPQRTWISAKNGSSHRAYCGLCTLFSSRKAHSIAAHTCTHGYPPWLLTLAKPTASAIRNASPSRIVVIVFSWAVVSLGKAQNQIEFVVMSAARSRWNAYVAHQPLGLARANGRFTATSTPPPAAVTLSAPRQSRAASRSTISGARNSPG
jgi:hypothetical protein